MIRKIMTTVVLGASAFGMMAANAAVPGVYVTGQLGYADTHMKAKTYGDDFKRGPTGTNLDNNGLAGRLAVGYQFNRNLAVELGYLKLQNGKYDQLPGWGGQVGTEKLKQNAIDLAVKGILPVSDKFNAYGKFGLAYLTSNISFKAKYVPTIPSDENLAYGIAKHTWAPEVAVGVSYDITPNVSIDTSWTHIQPLGKKRPGNVDFVAVGLGYNFG